MAERFFQTTNHRLHAEQVPIHELVQAYGSPLYVYSTNALMERLALFNQLLPQNSQLFYSVKANANLSLLALMGKQVSGFNVVSAGELYKVLAAGIPPQRIYFSGVGKSLEDIEYALTRPLMHMVVESVEEFERVEAVAKASKTTCHIALRINPEVHANTHPGIATGQPDAKFGLTKAQAKGLLPRLVGHPNLAYKGLTVHVGSQIVDLETFSLAWGGLHELLTEANVVGLSTAFVNLGGGVGIMPGTSLKPWLREYMKAANAISQRFGVSVHLEPGRSLIAEAGILVCQVNYIKRQHRVRYAIVDAGMSHFIRPMLYQSVVEIKKENSTPSAPMHDYMVAGPICESTDVIGEITQVCLTQGELLVLPCAGAYGSVMASNYNGQRRAAEVLVDGHAHQLIRRRDTFLDLVAPEQIDEKRRPSSRAD